MDPAQALEAMEAPQAMIGWAREGDDDPADLWDACPRGAWTAWLVPVVAVPIELLVASVVEVLEAHVDDLDAGAAPLVYGLDTVVESLAREADREDLEEAATVCDGAAADPPITFRDSARTSYGAVARGIASVVRAAEALLAARFRAEAVRMRRAQDSARLFGTGADIFVGHEPAVLLHPEALATDPDQAELLFVVASCADAMERVDELDGPSAAASALRDAIERRL